MASSAITTRTANVTPIIAPVFRENLWNEAGCIEPTERRLIVAWGLLGSSFRNRCFGALHSSCLHSTGYNRRLTTIYQGACGTGCCEHQRNQCQGVGAASCRRLLNEVSVKKLSKDQPHRPVTSVVGIESKSEVNDGVGVGLTVVRELLSIHLVIIAVALKHMVIHLFPEDVGLFNVGLGVKGPWSLMTGGIVAGGTTLVVDTVGSMVDDVVARMSDVLGVGWTEDEVEDDDTKVKIDEGLRVDVKDPFVSGATVDEPKLEVPEEESTSVLLTEEVLDMTGTVDGW